MKIHVLNQKSAYLVIDSQIEYFKNSTILKANNNNGVWGKASKK